MGPKRVREADGQRDQAPDRSVGKEDEDDSSGDEVRWARLRYSV
jgi:hypothetical protein